MDIYGKILASGREATPAALPDAELERVRAAFLSLHKETCDRCALLGILCDACRAAVGECGALAVIERALKNPPADAEERP